MNARLTPGLMALALLVLTVYGPLAELRGITTDIMLRVRRIQGLAGGPRALEAAKLLGVG